MKKDNHALDKAILAALKLPGGLKVGTTPMGDYSNQQISHRLQKLCDKIDPQAFRAKLGHKSVRYFDTKERAANYASTHHRPENKKRTAIAEIQAIAHKKSEESAALKKSNQSGYELTEQDKTKIARHDWDESKGRFYVDPASVPVFRYGGNQV